MTAPPAATPALDIGDQFASCFNDALGIPSTAGRLFAALLMSDAPLTQAQLRTRLELSEGSVSEGIRLLERLGFVERASPPRQRPASFHIRADAWAECARHTIVTVTTMRDLAASSLAAIGGTQTSVLARRLAEMFRMYDHLANELPNVLQRAVDATKQRDPAKAKNRR